MTPKRTTAAATTFSTSSNNAETTTTTVMMMMMMMMMRVARIAVGHLVAAWIAFQLGLVSTALVAVHRNSPDQQAVMMMAPIDCSTMLDSATTGSGRGGVGRWGPKRPRSKEEHERDDNGSLVRWWESGVEPAAAQLATVPKNDFLTAFSSGFPWNVFADSPSPHASRVLVVPLQYRRPDASSSGRTVVVVPRVYNGTRDAVSTCREVRQVVTRSMVARAKVVERSCLAIVSRGPAATDSYLLQKWIRRGPKGADASAAQGMWHMAGRYDKERYGTNTLEDLPLSKKRDLATISRNELASYLTAAVHRPETLQRLQVVADQVARAGPPRVRGTVVVLTVNSGHVDLFVNYVCAARAAHIDLNKLLLIATDEASWKVAKRLGVAAFYDADVFAVVPTAAAQIYGDGVYAKVMMSKAYSVHLLSMTGHNFLFQDVDIIPYNKNYLEWWIDLVMGSGYDLVFQNDFSNRVDYAPWSANSGCYFAVNNARTRYFFADMVLRGDSILKTRSHQAPMHAVLSDHASLFGLRVRTIQSESSLIPMGYHFHRRPDMFRDPLFKNNTMSLHMNWNREKTSKRLFLEQMGDWHVRDECLRANDADVEESLAPGLDSCCVDDPVPTCHYRDVPSVRNCDSSPALKSKPGAENA